MDQERDESPVRPEGEIQSPFPLLSCVTVHLRFIFPSIHFSASHLLDVGMHTQSWDSVFCFCFTPVFVDRDWSFGLTPPP